MSSNIDEIKRQDKKRFGIMAGAAVLAFAGAGFAVHTSLQTQEYDAYVTERLTKQEALAEAMGKDVFRYSAATTELQGLLREASTINNFITATRDAYFEHVIPPVKGALSRNQSPIKITMAPSADPAHPSIPYPATFTRIINEKFVDNEGGQLRVKSRVLSTNPINPDAKITVAHDLEVAKSFENGTERPLLYAADENGKLKVSYYVREDANNANCVSCHNKMKGTNEYKLGDMLGVRRITMTLGNTEFAKNIITPTLAGYQKAFDRYQLVLDAMTDGGAVDDIEIEKVDDDEFQLLLKKNKEALEDFSVVVGEFINRYPHYEMNKVNNTRPVNISAMQVQRARVLRLGQVMADTSNDVAQYYVQSVSEKHDFNSLLILLGSAFMVLFVLGGIAGAVGLIINRNNKLSMQEVESAARDAANSREKAEMLYRSVEGSVMNLLEEISDLADGDLTIEATVDEGMTGAVADAINNMIEEMREIVSAIEINAMQVASSAEETQATARQLAQSSNEQSEMIQKASGSVKEITNSIREVQKQVQMSNDVAAESVTHAKGGTEAVHKMIDGMDEIRQQIQETSKQIKRLSESSQQIGDIVEMIEGIAEQTSILSLNAAIQAAVAGEAGRGFAVVADEVSHLAERASNATGQIETLVRTIQTDTSEAIISMESTTNRVVTGTNLATQAGEALEKIVGVSERNANIVAKMAIETETQVEMAEEVHVIMSDIEKISEDTSSGTEETAQSIGMLADIASDLRGKVDHFTLPEKAEEMPVAAPTEA